MRKRSSKGGGAQRSIQVHLMVNEEEAAMIRAAERLRRLRAELGRDADGSDGPETSVRALHAAEQVKEALAYVRAVEKRLRAVQRLLMADAADNNGADRAGTTGGRDADSPPYWYKVYLFTSSLPFCTKFAPLLY